MGHIKQINVEKFRGINGLELSELGEVNLFVGSNNSGKTSVLEAMELFTDPFERSNYAKVASMRDSNRYYPLVDYILWLFPKIQEAKLEDKTEIWDSIHIQEIVNDQLNSLTIKPKLKTTLKQRLNSSKKNDTLCEEEEFYGFDDSSDLKRVLELNVKYEHGKEVTSKKLVFSDPPNAIDLVERNSSIKSIFITPVDHRIRQTSAKAIHEAIISGDRPKIISVLKLFDEDIISVEILAPEGRYPIPAINHKKLGIIPMFLFGDGLRKAMTLASAVIRSEGGILLIDELETAIHPTALTDLFSWLVNSCKLFNVQLFATTHSLEATDAVLKANEDYLNQLVAYRLEVNQEKTYAKRFSGETLQTLRFELGQDVR